MCWSDLSNRPDFGVIKQMLHAINDNRENTVTIKQVQMPKIMRCVRMTRIDFINFNFSLIILHFVIKHFTGSTVASYRL